MEDERLTVFERNRDGLRAVAYRLLGSFAEVDDVLQDAWLRHSAADVGSIENPDAWLTTVVARLALNRLRDRATRRAVLEAHFPDVIITAPEGRDPEKTALRTERLGVALLVVLDELSPAERVALVLHDAFALPFTDIAQVLDGTPAAARQLASRARRRIRSRATPPQPDAVRARAVVDAFLAAAERGDLAALVAVLHPDAVLRSDGGARRPAASAVLRGADDIAGGATRFAALAGAARPVLVNGAPGVLTAPRGVPVSLMVFAVADERIRAIDVLANPDRLALLDLRAT